MIKTEQVATVAEETQGGGDARSFFGLVFWLGIGGLFLLPLLGAVVAFIGGMLWMLAPIPNAIAAEAVDEDGQDRGGGCGGLFLVLIAIIGVGLIVGGGAVGMIETMCSADPLVTCSR